MTGHDQELDWGTGSDGTGAIRDLGAMERVPLAVLRPDLPQAHLWVETLDLSPLLGPSDHATILLMGSSRMSEAPASFSSGISLFTDSLGTTASTA